MVASCLAYQDGTKILLRKESQDRMTKFYVKAQTWLQSLQDESGQDLIEYCIVAAVVVAAATAASPGLQTAITGAVLTLTNSINAACSVVYRHRLVLSADNDRVLQIYEELVSEELALDDLKWSQDLQSRAQESVPQPPAAAPPSTS